MAETAACLPDHFWLGFFFGLAAFVGLTANSPSTALLNDSGIRIGGDRRVCLLAM